MARQDFEIAADGTALPDAKNREGHAKRIFCDCDGTLFGVALEDDYLGFNEPLFRFLVKLKQDGHDVTIFSGEPTSNQARVKLFSQKITGDALFFEDRDGFTVIPKSMVRGEDAYLVIDDDHSSHGVKAAHKWDPADVDVRVFIVRALTQVPPQPKTMDFFS